MRRTSRTDWIILLALAAFALADSALKWKGATFFSFQTRDLERARQVAQGALIFWGPEATGGGNLPGGLYYWMMAPALSLAGSWKGAWYAIAAIWAIARVLFFVFVRRAAGLAPALLAFVIFLPLPLLMNFLNVSVAPLFAVAALGSLCAAFVSVLPRTRARAWALACFSIGWGIQLHFSLIILLVAGALMQVLAPALRFRRLGARAFLGGLAVFGAPLAPYLIWAACDRMGFRFGEPAPAYSGSASAAIPSLLTLASDFRETLIFSEILAKTIFLVPLPLVAAIAAIAALRAAPSAATDANRGVARPRMENKLRRALFFCAAISFVPAVYFFLRPNGMRYTIPFTAALVALTALAHLRATRAEKVARIYAILCAAALVPILWLLRGELDSGLALRTMGAALVASAIVLLAGRRDSMKAEAWAILAFVAAGSLVSFQTTLGRSNRGIPKLWVPTVRQLTILSNRIHARTGWDFEAARRRLFFVDGQIELTPKEIYEEVVRERRAQPDFAEGLMQGGEAPDGFIITTAMPEREVPSGPDFFKEWILSQPLQADLARGLKDGGIELGRAFREGSLTMAPYWVHDSEHYPRHFQNVGYPYEKFPGDRVLEGLTAPTGSRRLDAAQILFFWNDCAGPWCTTGAKVGFDREGDKLRLHIEILGAPLEQTSEWTGPGWGQAWIAPYLKLRCGGRDKTVALLDSVGINYRIGTKISGMYEYYNSILAPVERTTVVPCPGRLEELRMGRESTVIYRMNGIETLPAVEAVFRDPE